MYLIPFETSVSSALFDAIGVNVMLIAFVDVLNGVGLFTSSYCQSYSGKAPPSPVPLFA